MVIIYDKKNNEVISSMGTNSMYPNGNIPNLQTLPENQIYLRVNDESDFVKKIMTSSKYRLILNNDNEIIEVNQIESLDKVVKEIQELDKLKPSNEEIEKAERQIYLINDLTELGVI